jgi:DNA polymerase-1
MDHLGWQGIGEQRDGVRINAENGAINTPIQGSASDYCIASLTKCVQWILDERVPAKLILPIHDSLLFDVREDAVEELKEVVPKIMCDWPTEGVPLRVDTEMGPSFGSLV